VLLHGPEGELDVYREGYVDDCFFHAIPLYSANA